MNQKNQEDCFDKSTKLFSKYKLWEKVVVLIIFYIFILWVYMSFFHLNEKTLP